MRGAAKNGPRAIIHQHEIGDIDWQFDRCIQRMGHANARIQTDFFCRLQRLGCGAADAAGIQKRSHFGICRTQGLGQGMIGGNRRKTGPHQRIGAGCINLKGIKPIGRANGAECKLQTA